MKRNVSVPCDEDYEIDKLTCDEDVWQYLHDVGDEVIKLKKRVYDLENGD